MWKNFALAFCKKSAQHRNYNFMTKCSNKEFSGKGNANIHVVVVSGTTGSSKYDTPHISMAKNSKKRASSSEFSGNSHNIEKDSSMRQIAEEAPRARFQEVLPQVPDVQIIEEKSSSATLLSSFGISSHNSSYEQCIRELEAKITAQATNTKQANDTFAENLNVLLSAQMQEIKELKRKQQLEIEVMKMDQERKIRGFEKKQQEMEGILSHLLRKSSQSS